MPSNTCPVVSLLFLAAFSSSIVCSEELTESDLMQQMPMVMSATRLSQPLADTPVATTIIDRELIDASAAVEIVDLLRLVPGMQVGLSWRNHHSGFTYHGQNDGLSRRMQVLVDGRVTLSSQFGLTDWDRLGIRLDDIERIEVVRGTSAASYGSHAYLGAINIITRDAALQPGWQLSSTQGANGLSIASGRYSYVGERSQQQLRFGQYRTDGFDSANDEVRAPYIRWSGDYQLSGQQSLDWQLGYAAGDGGGGGANEFPLVDTPRSTGIVESHAVVRWNNNLSPSNQWHLQLSYNNSVTDDRSTHGQLSDFFPAGLPAGVDDEPVLSGVIDLRADRTDLEFEQSLVLNSDQRLVWGAGARLNRMRGFLTLQDFGYFEDLSSRVFANLEQRFGPLLVNAGVLVEKGDLMSAEASYRVGGNYRINDRHVVRATVARGVRQPFIAEAFHELGLKTASGRLVDALLVVPQPLQPEKIDSYALGLVSELGPVQLDVKLFRDRLSNEIIEAANPFFPDLVTAVLPGSLVRINGGSTTIKGAEFSFDAELWRDSRLWVAYSYATADQESPAAAVRAQQTLSATPRHTLALSLAQQLPGQWQASLNYYYLAEMEWLFYGQPLSSYDRLDMKLSKTFDMGGSSFKVELLGQNLFGATYSEFNLSNQFDRRGFVRVSLDF
ncbi:TonB-dependent receptor [bacterium SCSIO 12696]|nr:TonB-dependent receptor [bacterium SCSIO 12696]